MPPLPDLGMTGSDLAWVDIYKTVMDYKELHHPECPIVSGSGGAGQSTLGNWEIHDNVVVCSWDCVVQTGGAADRATGCQKYWSSIW